ncbi:MAG: energy transducer TonB [Ferruginibacter sp.]
MNSELIMKSDVLDILFENRNKDYGAYMLRKCYNRRLFKALGIMIAAVTIFSAFAYLPEAAKPGIFIVSDPGFSQITPAPRVTEVRPRLIKPINKTASSTVKLLSAVIIADDEDSTDKLEDLQDRTVGSNTVILSNNPGIQLAGGSATGEEGNAGSGIPGEPLLDITKPIENPEIMPEYPGGIEALRKFLVRNLTNPRDLEAGEMISVKVKFVVGYDGKLKGFEFIQDGGSEFNMEVLRVLKKMPVWNPGKTKGRNVPVYYIIPVKFIPEG